MAVSVASFSELKSAVEDSGTTEILVTADIEFPSGGIKINTAKSSVVIDFGNHTVTDYNSLTFTNGIYIASTSATVSVTVKNAVWSGRNYYGVVGVYDGNTNCTIILENINYTGPQFAYNKNGVTIIRNCEVLLDKNGSSANPQEFCETNRVIIGGNVTVNSNSTSDALFWFTNANASLVVEENAIFVANATSSYFIYADVAPVLLFKQNSTTTISTKRGLFYASGASTHIASSFTLEKSASFIAYKFESNSVPMFKCQSNFTINENSIFQLYSENISSTALVYFGQTANISINSPSSLILYNRGGDVLSFQAGSTAVPNVISINAEMLRLWDIAKYPLSSAGNIQDTPTSEYHKANFAGNFTLALKTSTSQLISAESTLTEGDTGYPLSATTLKFLTSKVISIGKLDLEIDEITDQTTQISGKTSENANLLATYNTSSLTANASANGDFAIPLAEQIQVDTVVSITTNKPFLTKILTKTVAGTLSITNIDKLQFNTLVCPENIGTILRKNADFGITVTDSRTSGGEWYLYAYISAPLTSDNNTLENALIFAENNTTFTLNSTPLLVYTGKWSENSKITTISWSELQGFLLSVEPLKKYKTGTYTTQIFWQLTTEKL